MSTTTPNGIVIAHDDHGLDATQLNFIDEALADWDGSFILKVLTLPTRCLSLKCSLYGPCVGDPPITEDQVTYAKRNNRPGPSRLIAAPQRPARNMVVVGKRIDDGTLMLFTAYGTRATSPSPREWWDSSMKPTEAIEAAQFWSTHALATGGE